MANEYNDIDPRYLFDRNLNVMNDTLSRIIDKFYSMISATVNPYQSKVDSITEIMNSFDDLIASDEVDDSDREYFRYQKSYAAEKLSQYTSKARQLSPALSPAFEQFDQIINHNQDLLNYTISGIIDKMYDMIPIVVNPYQSKIDSITEIISACEKLINSDEVDDDAKGYYRQQKTVAENKLEHYMELAQRSEHNIYPAFEQFEQLMSHNQDLLNYTLSGLMNTIYNVMITNVNPYQSKVDSITEIINSYDKLIDSDEVETNAKEYYREQKVTAEMKLEHYVELSRNFEPALAEAFNYFKKIMLQNQNLLYYYQSMFTVSKLEDDDIITRKNATKLCKRLKKKYPVEDVDLSDMLENIDEDDYLKIDTEGGE